MSLQFNVSTYSEEFRSPCREAGPASTVLRPSQEQPPPQTGLLITQKAAGWAWTLAGSSFSDALGLWYTFLPPLQHLSGPCQEGKSPSLLLRPGSMEKPEAHRAAMSSAQPSLRPSPGQLCKAQPFDSPLRERQFQNSPKNTQGKMEPHKSMMQSNGHLNGTVECFPSDFQPHIIQGNRTILGNKLLKEPISKRPDSNFSLRYPKPQTYFKKSRSKTTLDPSAVYSCFQVVKPYKAGYYIIHPEFVSESLK